MKSVALMNATAADFANEITRAAIKNKRFALELMESGVKEEVTGELVRNLEKDCFDKAGKLTEAGRKKIFPELPATITLRQIFDSILKESYGAK